MSAPPKPSELTIIDAGHSFAPVSLLGACVDFIEGKLIDAAATLHAREEMERTWRGGTDEMWRAVGCTKTKAQRLKDADMHGRIAEKNRKEVAMFKAVLERLKAPNAEVSDQRGREKASASGATQCAPSDSLH